MKLHNVTKLNYKLMRPWLFDLNTKNSKKLPSIKTNQPDHVQAVVVIVMANSTPMIELVNAQPGVKLVNTVTNQTTLFVYAPRNHLKMPLHSLPPTYDNVKDVFTINNDKSINEIPAALSVNLAKLKQLPPKEMMIFPDNRASICIAGLQQLHMLGLLPTNLIPCYKQIKAVGGSILICKDWVPIMFNIATFQTTQPVYIYNKVDRIYLSKTGCIAPKIILPTFPFPMNSTSSESVAFVNSPSHPAKLPYPATKDNVEKLEQYLTDAF